MTTAAGKISISNSLARASALAFLDIISFAPVLMMLGNILPPLVLKVHQVAFGLAFVFAILTLSFFKKGQIYLLIVLAFNVAQLLMNQTLHAVEVFDFFFGPSVLFTLIMILQNDMLTREELRMRRKWFFSAALLPVIIASLQYFGIIPLTFLNATYVNDVLVDGKLLDRINGFFYHGNELVVLSFFLFMNLAYGKSNSRAFLWLSTLLGFAILTRYKSLMATSAALLIYYVFTINRFGGRLLKTIPKWVFVTAATAIAVAIISFVYLHIRDNYRLFGMPFQRTLLTGRGGIWTVYFASVADFSFWQHLFGGGIGSEGDQFASHVTAAAFYPKEMDPNSTIRPHPHNPWLGYYVNAGLLGILYMVYMLNKWMKQFRENKHVSLERAYAFAVLILPFLTFGVTIYITDMAIYWICLGFTLINTQYKQVIQVR